MYFNEQSTHFICLTLDIQMIKQNVTFVKKKILQAFQLNAQRAQKNLPEGRFISFSRT